MQQQQPNAPPALSQITAAQFSAKYQSKREVYRFLTTDVRAYLDSYEVVTIFHLRDICAKKRRMIKCDAVRVIALPHYESLRIEDILGYAEQYNGGEIMEALPITKKEILKLSRQYIANVCSTIAGLNFVDWCQQRIEQRNQKVTSDKDLNIDMDPEIFRIFQASTSVSLSKGSSGHLMKAASKRRRGKIKIQEARRLEEARLAETEQKLQQYDALEAELREYRSKIQRTEEAGAQIQQFFDAGVLRQADDGVIHINATPPVQQEQISSSMANQQQEQDYQRHERRRAQMFDMGGEVDNDKVLNDIEDDG